MNVNPRHAARVRAFTLIEMVLALAIAGVVLTAINTVFFGAMHLQSATVAVTEKTMPMDRAVNTLKSDLFGILPPGTNASTLVGPMGTDATVVGMTHTLILEFYTANAIISDDVPFGDVQKIDYWLQDPTNRNTTTVGQDLMRGVTRNLLASTPEPPEPHRVIGGVQSLRFSYYDGTNWNDNVWSTNLANVPVAIKGFLTFATPRGSSQPLNPPIQFLVPVTMAYSTNQTNQN